MLVSLSYVCCSGRDYVTLPRRCGTRACRKTLCVVRGSSVIVGSGEGRGLHCSHNSPAAVSVLTEVRQLLGRDSIYLAAR
jgi:hypothetical protein